MINRGSIRSAIIFCLGLPLLHVTLASPSPILIFAFAEKRTEKQSSRHLCLLVRETRFASFGFRYTFLTLVILIAICNLNYVYRSVHSSFGMNHGGSLQIFKFQHFGVIGRFVSRPIFILLFIRHFAPANTCISPSYGLSWHENDHGVSFLAFIANIFLVFAPLCASRSFHIYLCAVLILLFVSRASVRHTTTLQLDIGVLAVVRRAQ